MTNIRRSECATFIQQESYRARNERERKLMQAFLSCKNEKEMSALLRDLLTFSEIVEFANRLEMARLLKRGHSYQEVADKIGVSTTTVTRVAHWLFQGCGGYWKTLKKLHQE